MSTDKKTRIASVDIAKAIAIFTVLMGHTVDSDTVYKTVIYSFHMPLFFLLSGFVTSIRESYSKESWITFLYKKFWTILFPFALWGCIYSKFSFKNLVFILWGTRETLICADSLTSLWFLPVLFVAAILVELSGMLTVSLRKRIHSDAPAMAVCMAVCFAAGFIAPHYQKYGDPFGVDIAFIAAGFMIAGQLIRKFWQSAAGRKTFIHVLCFIGGLAGLIAYFVICRPEGYVLMANAVYGNKIAFLITSFLGSFLVLGAAEIISKIKPEQKLLPFIGRNTMGIFILHKPVVELMRRVVTHFGYGYNNIAMMILIPVAALCIVLPVLVLMQRFTPFMFGQIKSERSKS